MTKFIIVSPEELREMLEDIIDKKFSEKKELEKNISENLTLDKAIIFLKDNGFPTSKAKLYQLTSSNQISHSKFGNKLLFTRKSLLEWANQNTNDMTDNLEGFSEIVNSANHKRRKY